MYVDSYVPCDILKPFVKAFVIQELTTQSTYKVLPDTGLVVGLQYKGRLSRIQNGQETSLAAFGISGLADYSRTFKNSPNIGTILIFFKETGATQFFRHPLHELFRESLSLDNFMLRSELLCLEEQLAEAKTNIQRIHTVEQFLIQRMTYTEPDKLVLGGLSLIHKCNGNMRITDLAKLLHTSQSPLEKRFRQAVGASPKKYSSIVRLKNVIEEYGSANSLTALGYKTGFYDQAHFIKEFKTFTGESPEKFFSEKK